jgi:hypothetical protein
MAKKRPEFSFPELEHRGRNAILRTSAEVAAEEALLTEAGPESGPVDQPIQERSPVTQAPSIRRSPKRPDAGAEPSSPRTNPPAPTRARTRAPKSGPSSVVTDRLRQKLQAKQHLSSYTFRFRAEELEQLDRLVAELNQSRTAKLSKNDLVRLALGWLLTDYEAYGPESLVVEVTRHV